MRFSSYASGQTDRQTNRHTHYTTTYPSLGEVTTGISRYLYERLQPTTHILDVAYRLDLIFIQKIDMYWHTYTVYLEQRQPIDLVHVCTLDLRSGIYRPIYAVLIQKPDVTTV